MLQLKFFILLLSTTLLNGLMFDSMEHMKSLVELEQYFEEALNEYLNANRDSPSLEKVHEFAKLIRRDREIVEEQKEFYLDSPINSYLIIKRFTDGWSKLDTILKPGKKYEDLMDLLNSSNGTIPTGDNKDFFGAVAAILRLQNTYNITARTILEGHIPGCQVTTPLTADDAYEFGSAAYKGYQFMRAKEWIDEGIRLAKQPGYDGSITMEKFLEYESWLAYVTGDNKKALEITRELVKLAPHESKHHSNELQYRHLVEHQTPMTKSQIKAKNETNSTLFFMNSTYVKLCQGKPVELNYTHDTSRLKCWYHGRHDPRLRIGPLKVEQISVKPKIYMFRKFVSEYEATKIKELATPLLARATVFNPDTKKLENADYRVAKSAWLEEKLDDVVGRVNTRAAIATGLNKGYAEHLQVGNYGMGGQYETHVDFGDPGTPIDLDPYMGNRIATLLIYLNNVPSGGATVFPEAGIQVLPSKLDAAFWFNLKRSGEGDYTTVHAGCPVLCGNKWVANKWFRVKGNMFTRPCALDKNI